MLELARALWLPSLETRATETLEDAREPVAVRVAAARYASVQSASKHLITFLDDESVSIVIASIRQLASLRAGKATPKLLELIDHDHPQVRRNAMNAVRRIRSTENAPLVVALLADDDAQVRARALRILGAWRATDTAPSIVPFLEDDDAGVRRWAVYALGCFGDRKHVPNMIVRLTDGDLGVRIQTARSLANMNATDALPDLIALIVDAGEDEVVRRTAIRSVERFGRHDIEEDLLPLIHDPNPAIREEVLSLFVSWGSTGAIPELTAQLNRKETNGDLQVDLLATLADLPDHGQDKAIFAFLTDGNRNKAVRIRAIERIGNLRLDGPMLRGMAGLIASKETFIADAASDAITAQLPWYIADKIVPYLAHPRKEVRRRAEIILREMNVTYALDELQPLLASEDRNVRGIAIDLLAKVETGMLEPYLKSKDVRVRSAVGAALCRRKERAGITALLEAGIAEDLGALNAVLRPVEWNRLLRQKFPKDQTGTRRQLLGALTPVMEDGALKGGDPIRIRKGTTYVSALNRLLRETNHSWILTSEGTIRILPAAEIPAAWKRQGFPLKKK